MFQNVQVKSKTPYRMKNDKDKCLTAVSALKDSKYGLCVHAACGWVFKKLVLKQAFPSTFFHGQKEVPDSIHGIVYLSFLFLN